MPGSLLPCSSIAPLCPRSSRGCSGGRESAPSTAISVHFQLFPHWPPIGRAPQQRLHCAAIGSPLAGQCTNYVTVQCHVTTRPPCWTADCCADDCYPCHCRGFVFNLLQISSEELAVRLHVERNLWPRCLPNFEAPRVLVPLFEGEILN